MITEDLRNENSDPNQLILSILGEEKFLLIDKYVDIICEWNKKINLVSRRNSKKDVMWLVVDSLGLIPHLQSAVEVYDIGSGAGFPGVPLAIAFGLINDCGNKTISGDWGDKAKDAFRKEDIKYNNNSLDNFYDKITDNMVPDITWNEVDKSDVFVDFNVTSKHKNFLKLILVEVMQKRAKFLQHVCSELNLFSAGVQVLRKDARELISSCESVVFTAKAVASCHKMIDLCNRACRGKFPPRFLLLKGPAYLEEIRELERDYKFRLQVFPNCYKKGSVILEIDKVEKKKN